MSLLMLGAIVLIACNFIVALVSGADLRAKRTKLAKLEERREQAKAQLHEVEQQRKMVEGSRALHTRLKSEKETEIARQQQILGELEEITEEDREIKVASEDEKKAAEEADAHEIRTRIPAMKRKAEEKDEPERAIRMRTPKR